ncbi:hypothetical protein VQ056_31365 [Paenibacillus sp. JTLBN-2024]
MITLEVRHQKACWQQQVFLSSENARLPFEPLDFGMATGVYGAGQQVEISKIVVGIEDFISGKNRYSY